MRMQIMTAPKEISFVDVPVPDIAADQVLIKMKRIGICGSDIHVYHGQHPFTKYPITQGHECSGVVEKIGSDVSAVKVGQKVIIEPQVVCGVCWPCRHGRYNLCEELKVMGFQCPGTGAEYFACAAHHVTPLPDDFSMNDGAMMEPLAVAVHAIGQAGDVCGKDIVVIGAGPIGNLIAQVAKGMGAGKVMVTDVSEYRLELAKECGIDVTFNTRDRDFKEALLEAFGPDGADVIYECAGNNITINQAIHGARKGSLIILVAVFAGMASVDLATLNDKELNLNTSMMYRHEHFLKAIELVQDKKVKLAPLQTRHFPFEKWPAAYRYIDANRETTMKVLIDIPE